jgi:hypothetical protein
MKRMLSVELQNEAYFNHLYKSGFRWIRQYHPTDYNRITRNPTIGCIVEIFVQRDVGCIPINSTKGRKLINKLCYF